MPNKMASTTNIANIRKIAKNIFEILAAPDSIPLKPSKPATIAIIKNRMA